MSQTYRNNPSLPKDPNAFIQNVMNSISVLHDIYVQETEALVDADTETFLSIQEAKFEAARVYQAGVEALLNRKDDMKKVELKKKQELQEMQKRFSKLTEENKEALERMERCVMRVGDTLRNVAKDTMNKQRSINYGENGHMKKSDHKSVSMSINEEA